KWVKGGKPGYKPARILGHELAHIALACEGKLLTQVRLPLDKRDVLFQRPDGGGTALAKWENEIRQLTKEFDRNARAAGEYLRLTYNEPLSQFDDLGEYDAVMEWENPIAQELGENP